VRSHIGAKRISKADVVTQVYWSSFEKLLIVKAFTGIVSLATVWPQGCGRARESGEACP
jgi:hypothetical protein